MQNLITQATDSFLSSFVIKIKEMMLEFLLSLIEMINTHLMNLFETPIIRDFVSMGTTIGRFLFAATLIILLIDIVEEAGSMKNDQFKAIEWPTIFFNMVKAVVFIEAAPQLSIIALRMISISVGEFDPAPLFECNYQYGHQHVWYGHCNYCGRWIYITYDTTLWRDFNSGV